MGIQFPSSFQKKMNEFKNKFIQKYYYDKERGF